MEQLTYTHIKSISKNTWSPNFHFIVLHGDNSRFKKGKKENLKEKWYKKDLLNIKTIINIKSKFQTQIWIQILPAVKQSISTELPSRQHWPVPPVMHAAQVPVGCSFCSCVSIHMGFSSFFFRISPNLSIPMHQKMLLLCVAAESSTEKWKHK